LVWFLTGSRLALPRLATPLQRRSDSSSARATSGRRQLFFLTVLSGRRRCEVENRLVLTQLEGSDAPPQDRPRSLGRSLAWTRRCDESGPTRPTPTMRPGVTSSLSLFLPTLRSSTPGCMHA